MEDKKHSFTNQLDLFFIGAVIGTIIGACFSANVYIGAVIGAIIGACFSVNVYKGKSNKAEEKVNV